MKKTAIFLSKIAGIGAAALLLGTSAFADSRPLFATVSVADQGRDYERRDHDRRNVTLEGRVTRITPERQGYRVVLDHGDYAFWVRDLNIGRYGHGSAPPRHQHPHRRVLRAALRLRHRRLVRLAR